MQTLHARLLKDLPEGAKVGEPCPSPLSKAHAQYRFQLLLRAEKIRPLVAHLQRVLSEMTFPEEVIVTWDVDAMSLM